MLTYTTLDRDVLDLSTLGERERAFFDRCYAAYQQAAPYEQFRVLVDGPENPLLGSSHGRITMVVRRHPLWQAVRDLEDRIGIRQGEIGAEPGDDVDCDPIADQWLPAMQAAEIKGVTLAGLHKAIERGVVIAAPAKPGGVRRLVSRNSLDHWTPNPIRQKAGRARAATTA